MVSGTPGDLPNTSQSKAIVRGRMSSFSAGTRSKFTGCLVDYNNISFKEVEVLRSCFVDVA